MGRRSIHLIAVFGAVAVAAGILSSCSIVMGSTNADPGAVAPVVERPRVGGRLVFGLEADPNGLDPTRNAWDPSGLQLANALYDPIAAIDDKGVARPYLVESFTPSPDYLTWTFKLRPGVQFSKAMGGSEGLQRLGPFLQQ